MPGLLMPNGNYEGILSTKDRDLQKKLKQPNFLA
jgi:hypothetical protein